MKPETAYPTKRAIAFTIPQAHSRSVPAWWWDALLGVVLLVASSVFLARAPLRASETLALGVTDELVAQGFGSPDSTKEGRGFRWTHAESTVTLHTQGLGAHQLTLTMSAPRPTAAAVPVSVALNGQPLFATQQPAALRRYRVLVGAARIQQTTNRVALTSATFRPNARTSDEQLGVRLFAVGWQRAQEPTWLVPAQITLVGAAGALLLLLLQRAGIALAPRALALLLFTAITLTMRHSDMRFAYRLHALALTGGLALLFAGALALLRAQPAQQLMPLRAWLRLHWRALAGYLALTLVMLNQPILHFSTQIIGFPGDAYEYLWKMSWFHDALLRQNTSPAFVPQLFSPIGFELALSEMTPAQTLLGLPLTALFGALVSYNVMMVGSFVLTVFGTYLLAHRMGATRGAAWAAGIVFAFCTRRYYHSFGHFPLMGTQWLALTWYGWEGVLTRRRPWDAYLTGVGLALTSWTSWYYGPTFALLLAAYTPLRLGWRQLPALAQHARLVLLAAVVAAALTLPLAQPYIELRQSGAMYKHPYEELLLHSARPSEYLLPTRWHPLWGAWVEPLYREDGGEHIVTIGYTTLALTLVALWRYRRRRLVWALAAVIVINVVMTFGPELALAPGWTIALPARFVYEHVPVLDGIRVWTRMNLYIMLCAALLVALALSGWPRRWQTAAWVAAAALLAFESAAVLPLTAPQPRAVDVWLRQQPGDGAVIEIPEGFSGSGEYFASFYQRPYNLGYGSFDPPLYRTERLVLGLFPDRRALQLLQRWQTAYIVINASVLSRQQPDWEQALARTGMVTRVYRSGEYQVYRFR